MNRKLARRAFAALAFGLVAALALPAHGASHPTPVTSEWTVAGTSNRRGDYTGRATVTLAGDKATLTATLTFASTSAAANRTFTFTASGTQADGDLDLTLTLDTDDHDLLGVSQGGSLVGSGEAEYVIGSDGRTLRGYWSVDRVKVSGKRKTVHGAGATETLTLAAGSPLVAAAPNLAAPALPSDALPVPIMTQPDDYSCGPCSLEACFYYYAVDDGAGVKYLYPLVHTTLKDGTEPGDLATYAGELGLESSFRTNATVADLRASLAARDPVIVDLQAWSDGLDPDWKSDLKDGHYVVLIGMDTTYAYFMDPSAHFGYAYMTLADLDDRWHDTTASGKRFDHGAIFLHGRAPVGRALPLVLMR